VNGSRLLEVVRFEVAHQLRRPVTWLFCVVFAGLGVQFTVGVNLREGVAPNAPIILALVMVLGTLFGLVVVAAVAADAAARDTATGMRPLLATAPLRPSEYVFGRYLGALAVAALVLLTIPLTHAVASATPLVDRELVGPVRPLAYLTAYGLFGVTNLAVMTAIVFASALLTGRALAAFGTAIVLFIGGMIMNGPMEETLGPLGKVVEPFGMAALAELTTVWTAARTNAQIVWLEGPLLWNRLLWLGVGGAALALAYGRYRPLREGRRARLFRRAARMRFSAATVGANSAAAIRPAASVVEVPSVARAFGVSTHARQALSVARRSIRDIASTKVSWIVPALALLTVLVGPELMEHVGVPLRPGATLLVERVSETMFRFVPPLFTILFAGELVWDERDARLDGIADAAPVPGAGVFLGRFLALAVLLAAIQALTMAAGVAVQMRLGHRPLELGLHAGILFGLELPGHFVFAALALFVHVAVNQKYAGHLVALLVWASGMALPGLGIDHPLVLWGAAPDWSWSAMRGFGPTLGPFLWLHAYWAGWGIVLAAASVLLRVRGEPAGARGRIHAARRRLSAGTLGAATAGLAIALVAGGWTFYNANLLHDYRRAADARDLRAEYERRYGALADAPQPRLTGVELRVDIRPTRREAELAGVYRLRNDARSAIDTILVATALSIDVETLDIAFDRAAEPALVDDELGQRAYALDAPLAPGDSLTMRFAVQHAPRGFTARGASTAVTADATHFEAEDWLPALGYQRARELPGASERRRRGLPERPRIRTLEDPRAPWDFAGRERVALDLVVSTDADQTPLGPGRLERTWVEDGRRYARFSADAMRRGFPVFSGRYARHTLPWRDLDIEVYHDPRHAWNADRMARAVGAALDYHVERYGPYPYDWMRAVEAPGLDMGLRSHAGLIRYFEGYAHMHPEADRRDLDFAFAVMAHEVAHQWWGHRLVPAGAEGAAFLTESLAWYTALGVVEAEFGDAHLERLVALLREAYDEPRPPGEPSLLRATDTFAAYRHGPLSMFTLRKYLGAAPIDEALRRVLRAYDTGEPPLATSMDLYRELREVAPDSLRPFLADVLEHNVRWDLRVRDARAEPVGDGAWRVTMELEAGKLWLDGAGVATERPMDHPVEVGVFGQGTEGRRGERLYRAMHPLSSGAQTLAVRVEGEPSMVGVDPQRLLWDVNRRDNTAPVDVTPGAGG
jgi:ABC-2 type transport system permease protein